MVIKGKVFNSLLKEYSGVFEISSFQLEFVDPASLDCQIVCETTNHQKISIPIELEDYEILAEELYHNNKLDLSNYDYTIIVDN